jgi:hypothetical protein
MAGVFLYNKAPSEITSSAELAHNVLKPKK